MLDTGLGGTVGQFSFRVAQWGRRAGQFPFWVAQWDNFHPGSHSGPISIPSRTVWPHSGLTVKYRHVQGGHAKMRLFNDPLLEAISLLLVDGFSKTHRIRKAEDFS